jgi:hypothetical protein
VTKRRRLSWLLGALGFWPAAACVPAVPAHPSYGADVEPILAARCFRCHDGAYPIDPSETYVTGFIGGIRAFNNEAAAEAEAPLIDLYIHGHTMQMPPLPSAPLEGWQLQVLDNWAVDVAAGTIVP